MSTDTQTEVLPDDIELQVNDIHETVIVRY